MYNRVLIKLSGQQLAGSEGTGFSRAALDHHIAELAGARRMGVQLAVVVGGGNLWRGRDAEQTGLQAAEADYMGMLATLMNGLALRDALLREGIDAALLSHLPVPSVCLSYDRHTARHLLSEGKIVILGGGLGVPFFTTDSTAAVKAVELGAELLLKATRVGGVYPADPEKQAGLTPFRKISASEMLARGLKVVDSTALTLCREQKMPMVIYHAGKAGQLAHILRGEEAGSYILPE